MKTPRSLVALLVAVAFAATLALAQGARPTPPTRDPNTPGYVAAKELPDGTVPPPTADGNFIIGPTHNPAPETTVQDSVPQGATYNFTMSSSDSRIYPGHCAGARDVRDGRSERPRKADRHHQPSRSVRTQDRGLRSQTVRPGHARPVHRRCRRPGSVAVHDAGQPDRPETCAADDCDLDRQRQRRRAGQPARAGIRHDVRTLRGVRRVGSAAAGRTAIQREAHQGSRGPGDDGLQFRGDRRRWRWRGITRSSITACSPIPGRM